MKFALLIAALYAASPALAQQTTPMSKDSGETFYNQQDEPKPTRAPKAPTSLIGMSQSMTVLLNDGWTIAAANGVWAWTLFKGRKWAFCTIDTGQMSEHAPTSECHRLN